MGKEVTTKYQLGDIVIFKYKKKYFTGKIVGRTFAEQHTESDEQPDITIHYRIEGSGFNYPVPESIIEGIHEPYVIADTGEYLRGQVAEEYIKSTEQ
jgi:hypothetical protein